LIEEVNFEQDQDRHKSLTGLLCNKTLKSVGVGFGSVQYYVRGCSVGFMVLVNKAAQH